MKLLCERLENWSLSVLSISDHNSYTLFSHSQWKLHRDLSALIGFKYKGCHHSRCRSDKTVLVLLAECGTTDLLSRLLKANKGAVHSPVGGPQPSSSGVRERLV